MRSVTYVVKSNPNAVDLSQFGLYDASAKKLTLTTFTPKQLKDLHEIVLELGEIEPSEESKGGK